MKVAKKEVWRSYRILHRPYWENQRSLATLWFDVGSLSVSPTETPYEALQRREGVDDISLGGDIAITPMIECDDRSYLFYR